MKKVTKKMISLIVSIITLLVLCVGVTFAWVISTYAKGSISASNITYSATTTYSSSSNTFSWTYNKAGDSKDITVTTKNESSEPLHRFYNISTSTSDEVLKAILVYLDDSYIGTLNSILSTDSIESSFDYIAPGASKDETLSFELHQGASSSLFDGKSISITVTTYTENVDVSSNLYVSDEQDFASAISDINSGLLENEQTIVLLSSLTLSSSYTIENKATLNLNGFTLNGDLTLGGDDSSCSDALLAIEGDGSFNCDVTLGANYDSDGAISLIENQIKKLVKYGLAASSSVDFIGNYGFYNATLTTSDNITYSSQTKLYSTKSSDDNLYTSIEYVKVNENDEIEFKVIGTKIKLLEDTLSFMPDESETLKCDLFLPTSIPGENTTIQWTSSNEEVLTSNGKIVAAYAEGEVVTLYAEINVNNSVYTTSYTYKVSSHNNETNFYQLTQEISPLVITTIDSKYYLPTVDGDYDYRTSYTTPTDLNTYSWTAYKDIGLTDITYTLTSDQAEDYDYISIDGKNGIYLNRSTLSNYAKVTITGTFNNGSTYTSIVNISISTGSDTQFMEKAFTKVNNELDDISILGNILQTRLDDGMANEKGDFSLSGSYTSDTGEEYAITYTIPEDSSNVLSVSKDATKNVYNFSVDPTYFQESETSFPINVTVTYSKGETTLTQTRTVYVLTPATLHSDSFGTLSIFNSVKYQVFNALPDDEKDGTTGFSVNGSILTNSLADYILIRDMVGDSYYISSSGYEANDSYLEDIGYSEADYASGVTSIDLEVNSENNTSATDNDAYTLSLLVSWATSSSGERVLVSSVTTDSSLTSLLSTKSNGKSFISSDELAVIEAFYKAKTSSSLWNSEFSKMFETEPGYIYDTADVLVKVFKCLQQEKGNTFSEGATYTCDFGMIYAKYIEILNRYATTTSLNEYNTAPAKEVYDTKFIWSTTDTSYTGSSITTHDGTIWYRKNTGYNSSYNLYGKSSDYYSDKTSYITEAELTILKVFWLSAIETSTTSNGDATQFSSSSLAEIQQALDDNPEAYSGYSIADFDTYGEAILNGFDACLSLPTYFTSNGVEEMMTSFYQNYNGTGYSLKDYTNDEDTTSFASILNSNGVPYVTNLDSLEALLSYFPSLKTLVIKGNSSLTAFLSEYGVSKVFGRISTSNTSLTTLTMQYASTASFSFDITNISKLTSLTYIDLSNNLGITSITPLINASRGNYTYVDISNIGEEYEYNEFTIDNVASSTCVVYYSDASNNRVSSNTSNASYLSNLSNIDDFVSEYMYLANVLYTEDGVANDICWRIESGNNIYGSIIMAGNLYDTIADANAMNLYVSPYFYANESFTYDEFSFAQGGVYRIVLQDNDLQITRIHEDLTITAVGSVQSVYSDSELEALATTHTDQKVDDETIDSTSTYVSDTTIYTQTVEGEDTSYTIQYNYIRLSMSASIRIGYTSSYTTNTITYYLKCDGEEITCTDSADDSCNFVIVTANEAKVIRDIMKSNYIISNTKLEEYAQSYSYMSLDGTVVTFGLSSTSSISSNTSYYLFNPKEGVFLSKPGATQDPESAFRLTYSRSTLKIRYGTTSYYLNGTKTTSSGWRANSDQTGYYKAVFTVRYGASASNSMTTNGDSAEYNKSAWSMTTTFDTYTDTTSLTCRTNTPLLTKTQGSETTTTYNIIFKYYTFYSYLNSSYYLQDTGSYIADLTSSSNSNLDRYFVLLTADDCERLKAWYVNPTNNATFGNTYDGTTEYYIYNIYSQKYITIDDPSTASCYFLTVSDYTKAYKFRVNSTGISFLCSTDNSTRIYFNAWAGVSSTKIAGWDADGDGSKFIPTAGTYTKSEEKVIEADTTEIITYQFGYTIYQYNGSIYQSDTSKTYDIDNYYYLTSDVEITDDDGNVTTYKAGTIIEYKYDAYYGEKHNATLTYYVTEFWYIKDGEKQTLPINSGDITYSYYTQSEDSIDYHEGSIEFIASETYSQYDTGFTYVDSNGDTITQEYGEILVIEDSDNYDAAWYKSSSTTVIQSHTKLASESNLDTYKEAYQVNTYVCLEGGEEQVIDTYKNTKQTTGYTTNEGYTISVNTSTYELEWVDLGTTLTIASSYSETMDYFLETANSHFSDSQYSVYYGYYYAYGGETITTKLGNTYKTNTIYRLMPNASNTAFEFVEVNTYSEATGLNIMTYTATGEASVGDVYYCTKTGYSGFIPKDYFYKIEYDSLTDTLNMVYFDFLEIDVSDSSYTKITNEMIGYIANGAYIGYAGTFEIEISAVIRNVGGEEYVKTYKIKFVGTVISNA